MSIDMPLVGAWSDRQKADFARIPMTFEHRLAETGLFDDDRLAKVLDRYPAELFDINLFEFDADGQMRIQTGARGRLPGSEVLEGVKEGRVWLRERHFQRGVVNRFYAQRIGRFFPLSNIGRVDDMHVARIAGIRRSRFRIDQALPAPDHILSGNRRAVAPGDARTQMERPDGVVLVLPFFRQSGLDFACRGDAYQSFE